MDLKLLHKNIKENSCQCGSINRVFFWMNSIHGPFVIPELIDTTCPEKSSTLYAIFSQKKYFKFQQLFFFFFAEIIKIKITCASLIYVQLIWRTKIPYPENCKKKKKKRVILTIGCEIFAMYDNVPLQWIAIAGKESPICCVSVCLLVDIDSWCDVYWLIINKS